MTITSVTVDNKGKSPFNRPIAIFSDFDGTIFLQDTGHILFDHHGCGPETREMLDEMISTGERTFRGASEEMWGSLNVTLEDGFKTLKKHLVLDSGFKDFFDYTQTYSIPFNVISAGLKPLLRHVLDEVMGEEQSARIGIVSNNADISEDGSTWTPLWRHDCDLGHDKALSIQDYKASVRGEQPLIVFIGDGVSDLAAAGQADILFARKGLKLEQYCVKHSIPYIPYNSFKDIQQQLNVLIEGNPNHKKSNPVPTVAASGSSSIVPELPTAAVSQTASGKHSNLSKRPPLKAMLSGVAYAS